MASTTVTVYRNGDSTYPGKKLVVNRRQIRTMDALLDKVTKDVKLRNAARTIKTPTGRHTIKALDSIEAGASYVAVGSERFKRLPYTEIKVQAKYTPKKDVEITPVKHSRLQMSARARKVAEAEANSHKIIFVYRNGDDLYPSCKMLLDKRDLTTMDNVLKVVTNKVHLQSGAVFWLFTMEGKEIKEPEDLENGSQYVAVGHGKKFKKVAYSDQGSFLNSPRSKGANKNQHKVTPVAIKIKTNRTKNVHSRTNKASQSQKTSAGSSSKASSVQSPREVPSEEPIREDKQEEFISEPPIREVQEEYISQEEDSSRLPTDYVYRASGKDEEKAREVQDDKDVKEDKPIDQMPAEEVEEEDIIDEMNDTENNDVENKEITKQSQDSK